ncbi:MAG TPA: integration host factor subunit beta [Deltaproteobacteria bacterium]|nr:integration host factor subunit beta [Deltaproteobacteria bacterium]
MTKSDLISALRKEHDITRPEANFIVNLFFDEMSNALANGDRVEIRGLCSIYVKKYKAYTGLNPKTGERLKVKRKKLPFFKPGKELKDRVDYQRI